MATTLNVVPEVRPPSLEADAEQPPLFDGTTRFCNLWLCIQRLYIAYYCPFAQRAWITRNYKVISLFSAGLLPVISTYKLLVSPLFLDIIFLLGFFGGLQGLQNLQNRPAWYKEKVYPSNKVPALEHNGKVTGESLDLIKYIDSNFEGPSLFPDDPVKKQFGEELLAYTDTFLGAVYPSFKGDPVKEAGPQFDYLEAALQKFDDGPFFLGQFSGVDIAYITFIERFHVFLAKVFNYDITEGRPNLAAWIEVIIETVLLFSEIHSLYFLYAYNIYFHTTYTSIL
ncbi:Glutathione S-transferase L1, partial [Cucurbita argyrosperma subsp. argyrosperma]